MAAVADLHKSAFWIYGVTAMVMREPLGSWLRHAAESGLGAPAVQEEGLRVALVLALMSRFFLASGLFFDEVYLRPGSGTKYPRRSYALDFLCGLLQLLLAVGASTAIGVAPAYAAMVGAFLAFDAVWLAATAGMGLSTTARVAASARAGGATLLVSAAVWAGLAATGMEGGSRMAAAALLLGITGWQAARLVRAYDRAGASGTEAR
jgi:hypothetical protein